MFFNNLKREKYVNPICFRLLLTIAFCFLTGASTAQSLQHSLNCHEVLVPTDTAVKKHKDILYAYAYNHSEYDYNRRQSGITSTDGVTAWYEAFYGEYKGSRSSQEFSEAIRKRMDSERIKFTSSEADELISRPLNYHR